MEGLKVNTKPPQTDCELSNGTVVLGLSRSAGAIVHCRVDDHPLFITASAVSAPFPFANFALMPFSNRIAEGRFNFMGRDYVIPPNVPGPQFPVPIHGFGWQGDWDIEQLSKHEAVLRLQVAGTAWPSAFTAEQRITLTGTGYTHALSVTNIGEQAMPAGLGLHPYFPAGAEAISGSFSGRWLTGKDGLPYGHEQLSRQPDWFSGEQFDCGFDWPGPEITIDWPDRRVTITADPVFGHAIIYIPQNAPFFCVEPVTHATDAVNRQNEMVTLQPGKTLSGKVSFALQGKGD